MTAQDRTVQVIDSDELLTETNELLETLTVRIDREEQFLYPKFEAEVERETSGN